MKERSASEAVPSTASKRYELAPQRYAVELIARLDPLAIVVLVIAVMVYAARP